MTLNTTPNPTPNPTPAPAMTGTTGAPFGERVPRREDPRLLTGRGRFVADVRLPGMLHAAFVRSPIAHGRIATVDPGPARAVDGVVDVAVGADPDFALPGDRFLGLTATSAFPSHVETPQPALAFDRVRFAGEPVAAVVAVDRYAAEDGAEAVVVDYDELPAHVDARTAHNAPGPPVHDHAPGNVLIERTFDAGEVDAALAEAHLVLDRTYRTNRHAGVPLEGRAAVADWDRADETLTLHVTSQTPHIHRSAIAAALGLTDGQVRLVTGDTGGGFGVKAPLYVEYLAVAQLARRLGRPVSWVEDRSEHLLAAAHARDHHYQVRAGFDPDGRLIAVDATLHANVGAYSGYPWTAGLEPLMAGGLLTGPYKLDHYRCEVIGVATNTGIAGPYRGVARPATVFVMDRLLDDAAAVLGLDVVDIRRRNLVGPDDVPYTAPTRLVHDSRTYVECLDQAVARSGYAELRADQPAERAAGTYRGIGFSCYNELTGLGQKASAGPRLPFRTGHECVTVRLDPTGAVTVIGGTTSQGQGLETTLAQVVAAELGLGLDAISVEMGDTDRIQFGLGAFASRQGVIGSGAATVAARAVRDKLLRIAAHLLEAEPDWLTIDDGLIHTADAPAVGVTVAEVCRAAFLEPQRLPPDTEPGLEATRFYDPIIGTFAAGAQAAVVTVDVATGLVTIERLVVVEDTGRMINPMIVEGQVEGAVAQGIGGTLYEHLRYDERGQLLTGSFMDYLLPSTLEIPPIEVGHVADEAANLNGVRGVGEGGTLGPYAAIANAVCDALAPLGVTIDELPLSPDRVRAAIRAAAPTGGMRGTAS